MRILGLGISHDAGITLIEDGKLIFAINEERLDRIKLSSGFPLECMNYLKKYNISPKSIDAICIGGKYGMHIEPHTQLGELIKELDNTKHRVFIKNTQKILAPIYRSKYGLILFKILAPFLYKKRYKETIKLIRKMGFKCKVLFYDHHLCHAASAIFTCPKEIFEQKSLIITSDAAGDGLSTTVHTNMNGNIKLIHKVNQFNSLALLYQYVTEICGFTPFKHEGKITGLAAHGKPIYYSIFDKMVIYRNGSFYNVLGKQHGPAKQFILESLGKSEKELSFTDKANLAASVQKHLEDKMSSFVKYWIKKTGLKNLLLAGGIFANVKLNQRLWEIPDIGFIFIHQNMGDGGLSLGAATLHYFKETKQSIKINSNVYFGPEYSEKEIVKVLKKYELRYKKYNNIERIIAKLLSKNNIIHRFNGRMEYGPRALGNRSILFTTTDKTVNSWLNKKLNRTEFMPFAPVTLYEHAEKCYGTIKGAEFAARFMTITFNCTPYMKKISPAVVHLDGTARPQLIDKFSNTSYRKILWEYYKRTGIPSLINTSFNMHEEPIVCSPEDAVRSFLKSKIGYLAIGKYLISSKQDEK